MARRRPSARVTLDDVAHRAGVSRATVSKALNGRDDVAAATRERVLAAVGELGYRPTTGRRDAAPGRATLVAVLDVLESPYMTHVLGGILTAATAAGADLVVRLAPDRDVRVTRAAARAWVDEQRTAGAVGVIGVTLARPDALLLAAQEAGLPFVMVDPVDTQEAGVVGVGATNWAGGRTATEHLLALGHRRIAWIGGPETSTAARDRLYGYQAALDAAGIAVDPSLIRADHFTVSTGAIHARDLLTGPEPPTAIMAADDEIAVGVLATAHELGVRLPEDLSVTGFDDTPQAAWTTPPLTTVHQHLEGMGAMAVQTLRVMAEGQHPSSRHVELATSLTVRESTAPPRRR